MGKFRWIIMHLGMLLTVMLTLTPQPGWTMSNPTGGGRRSTPPTGRLSFSVPRVVDRRAIAGLWKLTPTVTPLKEFTVRPFQPPPKPQDILLLLKEDGSFRQYSSATATRAFDNGQGQTNPTTTAARGQSQPLEEEWKQFQLTVRQSQTNAGAMVGGISGQQGWEDTFIEAFLLHHSLGQGTWDFREGKLILAADRPSRNGLPTGSSSTTTGTGTSTGSSRPSTTGTSSTTSITSGGASNDDQQSALYTAAWKKQDTLLTGRVVVSYNTYQREYHPELSTPIPTTTTTTATTTTTTTTTNITSAHVAPNSTATAQGTTIPNPVNENSTTTTTRINNPSFTTDILLSVPQGRVKVGRFFYPQHHPNFFEQPMYRPLTRGTVSMRQLLGTFSTSAQDDRQSPGGALEEKFQNSDFYNKTFLLTAHPLGGNKDRKRWSQRQQKMVYASLQERRADEAEQNRPANIRVIQVQFHANNTFSTVAGIGESILRGKFDIIGPEKDQLWMQIWRFGFGRSVSGSVYSEGRMLSQHDAKTYWGTIKQVNDTTTTTGARKQGATADSTNGSTGNQQPVPRLEVDGSVIYGWGLEPIPEARFIMREVCSTDEDQWMDDTEDEDEEDNEDDDLSSDGRLQQSLEIGFVMDNNNLPEVDGVDWSNESGSESFQ